MNGDMADSSPIKMKGGFSANCRDSATNMNECGGSGTLYLVRSETL